MFWTVWGSAPAGVFRSGLAGDDVTTLADTRLVYPGALTLDLATDTLYWADTFLDTIESCSVDGTLRTTTATEYLVRDFSNYLSRASLGH